MGNTRKHTPAARIAAREAEINRIAFMCFLVAFLRCFLNVENAGILPFEIGEGAVLPGMQTSGVRRDLRIALCQIYKVESGLSAGVLRAGDPGRIIDSFAQPSMDDLYKSFCICSKDRKYFSGASGIKITQYPVPNEMPLGDQDELLLSPRNTWDCSSSAAAYRWSAVQS